MGEEADWMIRQLMDAAPRGKTLRRAAPIKGRDLVHVLKIGERITTQGLSAQHLTWEPPMRTLENMPENLKKEMEGRSEGFRAVAILSWLKNISKVQASAEIQAYKRKQREEENLQEKESWKREKLEQIEQAKTVEDLKGLLTEIVEKLWS